MSITNEKIALILLILFIASCSRPIDEQKYKKAATELNKMFIKYEKIPTQYTRIGSSSNSVQIVVDYSQKIQYVEKTKNDWLSIAKELNEIQRMYPKSKWANDSLFCLTMFTRLNPSEKTNEFDEIAIKALNKLIKNNQKIHLEEWTDNLSFIKQFNSSINDLFPSQLSMDAKYKAMLSLMLANELRKKGEFNTALNILIFLKNKYVGTEFEKLVQNQRELIYSTTGRR